MRASDVADRGKLVAGLDGTPLYVNDAALALLGVDREAANGVHVLELIAPLDGPAHTPGYEQLQVALREHTAASGLEVECRGPWGAGRRGVGGLEPRRAAGGEPADGPDSSPARCTPPSATAGPAES